MAGSLEAPHCSTCTCQYHQQSSFNVESPPDGVRLRRRQGSGANGEISTEVRDRGLEADSAATSRSGGGSTDEGSVPVQIDTSLPAPGDDEELVVSEVVANNLLELNSGDHPILKIAFDEWEAGFHIFTKRTEVKEAQRGHIRNEIYQLIGFFIVFQGVVYTAVAQAAVLRCANWWTSFTLSLLASVATIVAVVQKLCAQWALEETIANEKLSLKVLRKRISHVKSLGPSKFSFNKHAVDGESHPNKPGLSLISYMVAVIFILLAFSTVFLASCIRILCDPGPGPRT